MLAPSLGSAYSFFLVRKEEAGKGEGVECTALYPCSMEREREAAVSPLQATTFWCRRAITQLEPSTPALSLKPWLRFSLPCGLGQKLEKHPRSLQGETSGHTPKAVPISSVRLLFTRATIDWKGFHILISLEAEVQPHPEG